MPPLGIALIKACNTMVVTGQYSVRLVVILTLSSCKSSLEAKPSISRCEYICKAGASTGPLGLGLDNCRAILAKIASYPNAEFLAYSDNSKGIWVG